MMLGDRDVLNLSNVNVSFLCTFSRNKTFWQNWAEYG